MIDNHPTNILLIVADEMRWDCLGCAGHRVVQTPNLDRLAAHGVRFPNAYSTSPLCIPARAQMLTGMPCWETNVWGLNDRLPPSFFTYPRTLSQAGYFTGAVGKMHFSTMSGIGSVRESYGFQQLVLSEEGPSPRWRNEDDYWQYLCGHGYEHLGMYVHGKRSPDHNEMGFVAQVSELPMEHFDTTWTGRQTVRMIETHAQKPFAITCSFVKPHFPAELPSDWPCPYKVEDISLSPAYSLEHDEQEFNYMRAINKGFRSLGWLDEATLRKYTAYYYGNITLVDRQVGQILDKLDELGLTQSTLVVFTSDHGNSLGERGLLGKCSFYEESTRVPMILSGPMIHQPGRVDDRFVSLEDLCPTFLEAAGQTIPTPVIGQSLLPLLHTTQTQGREAIFGIMGGGGHFEPENAITFIRIGSWKFLYQFAGARHRLFNLQDDPNEMNDLAILPDHQDRCRKMNRELAALLNKHGADFLTRDDVLEQW